MKKYTVKQELTYEEKFRLLFLTLIRGKFFRIVFFTNFFVFFGEVVFTFTTLGINSINKNSLMSVLPRLIFPFEMFLLVGFALGFIVNIMALIASKSKQISSFTYEFDNQGMRVLSKDETIEYRWQEIAKYKERLELISITTGSDKPETYLIFKKAFADEMELSGFLDLLKMQVPVGV